MKVTKHVTLIMEIEPSETFKFKTRTGEIFVEELRFHPEDFDESEPDDDGVKSRFRKAWVRGTAIKNDGTRALFDRRDYIPFSDIPPHLLHAAVREFNNNKKVAL